MATKTAKKPAAKKTNLRPTDDRVIVRPQQAEEVTASGIVLPGSAREKPMQGDIVAAGPGRLNDEGERQPMGVGVGDRVLYGRYSGTEVEVDGESLLILRESELLAKLV